MYLPTAIILGKLSQEAKDFVIFILAVLLVVAVIHGWVQQPFDVNVWFIALCFGIAIHALNYCFVELLYSSLLACTTMSVLILAYFCYVYITQYKLVMSSTHERVRQARKHLLKRFLIQEQARSFSSGAYQVNYQNLANLVIIILYLCFLGLLIISMIPSSFSCDGYNSVVSGSTWTVNSDFCDGKIKIAFIGQYSTGKTTVINNLAGRPYYGSVINDAPATTAFSCIIFQSKYNERIQADDTNVRHCRILDAIRKQWVPQQQLLDFVALDSPQLSDFVFIDTPGYLQAYAELSQYRDFYEHLVDLADYTFLLWTVENGDLHNGLTALFKNKVLGSSYDIIYNKYSGGDLSFLKTQYSKMHVGHEMANENFIIKVPRFVVESNDTNDDTQVTAFLLKKRIFAIKNTVQVNRKAELKKKLETFQKQVIGFMSLIRYMQAARFIQELDPFYNNY